MTILLYLLLAIILVIAALAVIGKLFLSGEDLSKYDGPLTLFADSDPNAKETLEANAYLRDIMSTSGNMTSKKTLAESRATIEESGLRREFPVTLTPQKVGDMDAEWVQAEGADPDRRILFLHGGAFTVGSFISHRPITAKLATLTGCSVLVVNYRLMPENPRRASIVDSRAAYNWILENGPNGPGAPEMLGVSGDSAGGNLSLMISNYCKSEGVRAPDAVAALSPAVDSLITSPTAKTNMQTDIMLSPMFKPLSKIPRFLVPWVALALFRHKGANPDISPIYADLSALPPTLVQASYTEILRGDGARYAAKAQDAGSDVRLQLWNHMQHVWQFFDEMLPQADHAMQEVAKFFAEFGVKGK